MAINCVTYNCRGWNSGSVTISDFIDLFDINFVSSSSIGFLLIKYIYFHPITLLCQSVELMTMSFCLAVLTVGVLSCIGLYSLLLLLLFTLYNISNRFCALKVKDQSGLGILLVCVYMPSSDIADYQDTLGALEGFIESYQCDINVIVGDFNVGFSRQSAFTHHLSTLMTSLDLIACDLHSNTITYTYERDGGSVRSWIDHVLCNESYSNLINQLHELWN